VFSLVSNVAFIALVAWREVYIWQLVLHFNMNYICNKLFLCCALNPINTQKPPNQTLTCFQWNKIIKKQQIMIIIFSYLVWIILDSWKSNTSFNYCVQFVLMDFDPNFDIPCHLQSSCICKTSGSNHLL
jgi:hypothetical protein